MSKKNNDTTVYYPYCFHCNPDRIVTLHPTKALQNAQNPPPTLDFVHLQPSISPKNVQKEKRVELKSFDRKSSSTTTTTPLPRTLADKLYSKQKCFMYKFNVNILDKCSILKFNSIMKEFMSELSYDPNDKSDVYLFYMQEDMEELYNIYKLRGAFKNQFTLYDDAFDNIHLIEKFQKMKI